MAVKSENYLIMELKPDIGARSISQEILCHSCLCVGRSLHKIEDQKLCQYYLGILDEIPLSKDTTTSVAVCWECKALLEKSIAFREQVKDSYRILQTYTYENLSECLFSDISRPPRLKIYCTDPVDIPPTQPDDNSFVDILSFVKDEPKNDMESVKDEASDADDCLGFDCDDLQESETEFNDVTTLEKPNRQTSKGKERGTDSKEIVKRRADKKKKSPRLNKLNNIITIEMTYDDMLLERQKEASNEKYIKAKFKCESCLIVFQQSLLYDKHKRAKHSTSLGDYSCPVCDTVFPSVKTFTSHYKRHLKRYECSVCKKRSLNLKMIQQHYKTAHEKEYKCNICGTVSNSIDTHRYHKESHKSRLACRQCDKTFRHRAGLLNHTLVVHQSKSRFPCTRCDKVFQWRTSLSRHLEKHDVKGNGTRFAAYCSTCEVTFASPCSYQRHLKNSLKHVTEDQFKYICDDCNRRFTDKTKLRDHIEEKHLHRTFKCDICLKPAKNRVGLEQHVRNVHRGRPLDKMCHHCGKGFPTKSQLESHIRSHTGERPFICELCPTTFSQQANLYKHMRQVHLNIKTKRNPVRKSKDPPPPDPPNVPHTQTVDYRPDGVFQYSPERGYVM